MSPDKGSFFFVEEGGMRLIFLDANGERHLVADGILTGVDGFYQMYEDLKTRRPGFKSYYTNCSYLNDSSISIWIDFGSHTEFYILEADQ